jgi:hypothetical protein
LLHRPKTAAPPSAENSSLCLPRSPPDLGVSFVMAPHLTRPALGLATLPPVLGMTSFFAVRYSLVPPATTLLSWLHSRTPQTTVWICFNSFHPNPDPVFLFVDNLYAINTATGRWTAKSNLDEKNPIEKEKNKIYLILSIGFFLMLSLPSIPPYLPWVPGHSLVYGNEIADLLAKRGADGTTRSSIYLMFPPSIIFASNAIFRH